jgi:uncharacterized Fe-S cluster-containing radical SAM superfamily protein
MLEKHVTRDYERKYYRFRVDRWYGGIVTVDCVGCGLFCKFCWVSDNVRLNPLNYFWKLLLSLALLDIFRHLDPAGIIYIILSEFTLTKKKS